MRGISGLDEDLSASQEGLCSVEFCFSVILFSITEICRVITKRS